VAWPEAVAAGVTRGLTAACQAALDSGTAGTRHGAAPHLSILTDEATLAGEEGAPPASTGYGTTLTARQVLALACRAEISVIRCRDGVPLDVGRMQRTETPAIRRALHARDRGCRWPGCGIPATAGSPSPVPCPPPAGPAPRRGARRHPGGKTGPACAGQ
jgi:hypothetical protein